MLTKKGILKFLRRNNNRTLSAREIVTGMGLKDGGTRRLRGLLKEMENDGQVYLTKGQKYALPDKLSLIVGKLQGHAKGYGFVIPEAPGVADLYVSRANLNGAMHNDKVIARVTAKAGHGRGSEGEVVRVIKRANTRLIGTFHLLRQVGYVVPDEDRLGDEVSIAKGRHKNATSGDKVVVEITSWPEKRRGPAGRIVEVLGSAGAPGVQSRALCIKYNLEEEFPARVLAEANKLKEVTAEEVKGRRDLRQLEMVTIDGEDAKDLDDAVSLTVLEGGAFRLGVHIADVSYYVQEGGALDEEARKRATSVYLVDRVLPMLPPQLSNDICSLNPRADRLALSVVMDIDREGRIFNYDIFPSVININERMTYSALRKILVEQDPDVLGQYPAFHDTFYKMEELCRILAQKRRSRGAIDFNLPEMKIELDESGKPISISKRDRTIAEQIIEEFMLAANETVAEHFYHLDIPFLYRIHEEPDEDKIKALNEFLYNFGHSIGGSAEGHHSGDYSDRGAAPGKARGGRSAQHNAAKGGYAPDKDGGDLIDQNAAFGNARGGRSAQHNAAKGGYAPDDKDGGDGGDHIDQNTPDDKARRGSHSAEYSGVHPGAIQRVLEEVKDKPEERLINTVVLRSMQRAVYAPKNAGHFGLAAEHYTHFTAPIRRYPDLMIHRIIHEVLAGGMLSDERAEKLESELTPLAEHCSNMERVAMDAERESADIKAAEYMRTQLGEVFDGVISGLTSFGIFVELDNLVEGFVHLSTITDDYYEYNEKNLTLVGQRTRKMFRIGDLVTIRVVRVNVEQHMIDFELKFP